MVPHTIISLRSKSPGARRSRRTTFVRVALLFWLLGSGPALVRAQPSRTPHASTNSAEQLRTGFASPPAQAKLRCYWWWLNGNTDKATITHDLEEMRAKGFGGALLVDANGANQEGNRNVPAGPTFASPAWLDLYTHALHEADRLGLEITLNITSGWNLGGPDVTPEQASKLLTWTQTELTGGTHVTLRLPTPQSKNGFYQQIAVLAYPLPHEAPPPSQQLTPAFRTRIAAAETGFSMPDSTGMLNPDAGATGKAPDTTLRDVRDISASVTQEGALSWDPPPGRWEILRIGYTDSDARVSTSSGAWQGLAIDYMSREAFDTYWNHTVEPLLSAAKPYRSLTYLATDSWELGGANWTPTFREEFQKRRGYDPVPWLPTVAGRIVQDPDASTRFLTDLRRTVADLIVSNHYDVFAQRAAQHGLGVQSESGGPHGAPIDALETFRHAAVPQSEFWSQNPHRSRDQDRFFTKEAASAANIYGQRLVAQEGETSIGPQWSESLATDLKPSFDMAITEGMNRLVWHEFTSSPASTGLPGQEYFAGTHIDPKVTWWHAGDAFFKYLNRVQFLMQQGTPVDDVLYFYGDTVPNFVRLKADDPAHVLPGYDYDVTDEDALLRTIHTEGNLLEGPSGITWRALALPASGRLSLPALQRIEQFAQQGATIVGNPPTSPPGMLNASDSEAFNRLVAAVWGKDCRAGSSHSYGKGQIICTQDAHAALQTMHVLPDVALAPVQTETLGASSAATLDYAHRRSAAEEIYFFRNGSAERSKQQITLRAHSTAIELWDPVTGDTHRVQEARILPDGRTRISVELPPFGSVFILFLNHNSEASPEPVTERTQPLTTSVPWNVTFQPGRGAPDRPLSRNSLTSWTEWPEPGVRYFSGTATYTTQVTSPAFDKENRVLLHFSDLREIAQVKVNGHLAGTVWAKPLTLRVDPWLKPGLNTLEIEVTNLWPNRIIGDLQLGARQHVTQTNINTYHADSPLLPSGLIGDIEWLIQK